MLSQATSNIYLRRYVFLLLVLIARLAWYFPFPIGKQFYNHHLAIYGTIIIKKNRRKIKRKKKDAIILTRWNEEKNQFLKSKSSNTQFFKYIFEYRYLSRRSFFFFFFILNLLIA